MLCEDEAEDGVTRGATPIVDLTSSDGTLARRNSSAEVWKLSDEVTVVSRTSEASLLPRLVTWRKSEDIAQNILDFIESEMRKCPDAESQPFCFRSRGLVEITKLSKDLRQNVPGILDIEVDPNGGPRVQEAAMKLYAEKDGFERIHLVQGLQAIEMGVKRFYYSYKQLLTVVMGSLEAGDSGDSLDLVFLEPTYFSSLDAAKTRRQPPHSLRTLSDVAPPRTSSTATAADPTAATVASASPAKTPTLPPLLLRRRRRYHCLCPSPHRPDFSSPDDTLLVPSPPPPICRADANEAAVILLSSYITISPLLIFILCHRKLIYQFAAFHSCRLVFSVIERYDWIVLLFMKIGSSLLLKLLEKDEACFLKHPIDEEFESLYSVLISIINLYCNETTTRFTIAICILN
nr:nematode resistance protein-like HSPRO2 [Ipomoea trifida]